MADFVLPAESLIPDPTCTGIFDEIREERIRAHNKHGDTSMESLDIDDLTRLTVLRATP